MYFGFAPYLLDDLAALLHELPNISLICPSQRFKAII